MYLTFVVRHLIVLLALAALVSKAPAQSIVVTDDNKVRITNGAAPSLFPVSTFPDAQVGVSQSITYHIHNDSAFPLTISNIQTLGPAEVTTGYDPPAALTIEPFNSTFATLRARADVAGTYNIQVTILSDSFSDSTFVLNLVITATETLTAKPDLDMKFWTNIDARLNEKHSRIDLKVKGIASNVGTLSSEGDQVFVFRTAKRYLDETATLLGTVPVKQLPIPKKLGKPFKTKKVKFKGSTEISQSTIYLVLMPTTSADSDWSNNVASMFYRVSE